MVFKLRIDVTSPGKAGGGRIEPSATFGRGHVRCAAISFLVRNLLFGSRPELQLLESHPLPELAALAPTSPGFAGRGDRWGGCGAC